MRQTPPTAHVRWLPRLAASVAVVYSLLLPVLGLQDMMAPTMFANLRVFSGSNHLLLPTGLLFRAPSLFPTFGGGVVWVESTSSATIRGVYPGEATRMLSPAVRTHLQATGHSGREYAPYLARVIGPDAIDPQAVIRDDEAWMVPMVELRRLLAEARAAGETFSLTFRTATSDGPGAPPGAPSTWRRVRVDQSGRDADGAHQQCSVLDGWPIAWLGGSACTPEEAQLLSTPPPPWAMRWLLFFPFPMRLSDDLSADSHEIGCLS
jgi:hypothetical protein